MKLMIEIMIFLMFITVLHAGDLFEAAASNDIAAMKSLIESSAASIKDVDAYGRTPLHLACLNGAMDCAEYLIQKGADINARAGNGMTPLHLAVIGNRLEMTGYLMDHKADGNIRDKAGMSMQPLQYACIQGNKEIVQLLIEKYHLDVNTADDIGTTLLMTAAWKSNLDLARYLIAKGADLNRKKWRPQDSVQMTALDHANYALLVSSNEQSIAFVNYLKSIGAKTATELNKKTP